MDVLLVSNGAGFNPLIQTWLENQGHTVTNQGAGTDVPANIADYGLVVIGVGALLHFAPSGVSQWNESTVPQIDLSEGWADWGRAAAAAATTSGTGVRVVAAAPTWLTDTFPPGPYTIVTSTTNFPYVDTSDMIASAVRLIEREASGANFTYGWEFEPGAAIGVDTTVSGIICVSFSQATGKFNANGDAMLNLMISRVTGGIASGGGMQRLGRRRIFS